LLDTALDGDFLRCFPRETARDGAIVRIPRAKQCSTAVSLLHVPRERVLKSGSEVPFRHEQVLDADVNAPVRTGMGA
jgi:hypothetical protein